jgi:serine/threonine-protein kinase
VKLIRSSLLDSDPDKAEMMMARFEREAQATAALRSPHSVRVYDFGRGADGSFYYVMELLNGLDLEDLVERFGPQPPERTAYILAQVCESLAEAHGVGLVHRDIKPANIFLSRHGRRSDFVSVLDFGMVKASGPIAGSDIKLTSEDAMAGTIAYAAPECYLNPNGLDARADLYSLGCVAYWLLTGWLTFDGDNAMQVAMKHVGAKVVPPSQLSPAPIPARLEELVLACLEKDPSARPGNVEERGAELAALAQAGGWDNRRALAWWDERLPAGATAETTPAEALELRPRKMNGATWQER